MEVTVPNVFIVICVASSFGLAVYLFAMATVTLFNEAFLLGKIDIPAEIMAEWDRVNLGEASQDELNTKLRKMVVARFGTTWGSFNANKMTRKIKVKRLSI